jgi:hypothetical protein
LRIHCFRRPGFKSGKFSEMTMLRSTNCDYWS